MTTVRSRRCSVPGCAHIAEFYLNGDQEQARCIEHGALELRKYGTHLDRIPLADMVLPETDDGSPSGA